MLSRTSWREGAGQREHQNLFALDQVGHLKGVRAECATGGFCFNKFCEGGIGYPIADFDRHLRSPRASRTARAATTDPSVSPIISY